VQDLKDFAQITIEKKAEEGDRSGCPASLKNPLVPHICA